MHPRAAALLVLPVAVAVGLACVHTHHSRPPPASRRPALAKHGPPPHAPAHGHRHKHRAHGTDVELVFDSGAGAYVVVGWPGHYFQADRFYRQSRGVWQVSVRLDDGWHVVLARKLPPGLAKKGRAHDHGPSKGRKKGGHPAKHGY